jgi:hypothetical protein
MLPRFAPIPGVKEVEMARRDPVVAASIAVLVIVAGVWFWRRQLAPPPEAIPTADAQQPADAPTNAPEPVARIDDLPRTEASRPVDAAPARGEPQDPVVVLGGPDASPIPRWLQLPPEDVVELICVDPFLRERLATPEGLALVEDEMARWHRERVVVRQLQATLTQSVLERTHAERRTRIARDAAHGAAPRAVETPVEPDANTIVMQAPGSDGQNSSLAIRRDSSPDLFAVREAATADASDLRAAILRRALERFPELVR